MKNKFCGFTTLVILSLFILSCNKPDPYKYKIVGNIKVKIKQGDYFQGYTVKETINPIIAFTDTIHGFTKDSIWYFNSNGTKVNILPPYFIEKIK